MIIEQAIYNRLKLSAGVVALVADKIYYTGRVIQAVSLPYVVIQTIDEIPVNSHSGFSGLTTTRIQINCFDDSYVDCKLVNFAIFAALNGFVGTMGGVGGVYVGSCLMDISGDFPNDNNPNISGIHTDYIIQYNS